MVDKHGLSSLLSEQDHRVGLTGSKETQRLPAAQGHVPATEPALFNSDIYRNSAPTGKLSLQGGVDQFFISESGYVPCPGLAGRRRMCALSLRGRQL